MTESEYLTSTDPAALLRHVEGRATEEQLRWFVEACRAAFMRNPDDWSLSDDWRGLARSWAEGGCERRAALLREIFGPFRPLQRKYISCLCGGELVPLKKDTLPLLSVCSKCHADGPFWADVVHGEKWPWLAWNDGTIPHLARSIHDSGRFEDMAILADALVEAGCQEEELIAHCRNLERCWKCLGADIASRPRDWDIVCPECHGTGWTPLRGPHVPGCWLTTLLAGVPS